jgi:hypothetical protein
METKAKQQAKNEKRQNKRGNGVLNHRRVNIEGSYLYSPKLE